MTAERTGRGQEEASGTGVQNLGSSKDKERPGGGLRYRSTELNLGNSKCRGEARTLPQVQGYRTLTAARTGRGQEEASGTGVQNLGSSKDKERPGGGLRYRSTELNLGNSKCRGEARIGLWYRIYYLS